MYFGGVLSSFVEDFDWTASADPLFREIYRLHVQWLLQPSRSVVSIDLTDDQGARPHPLPCDTDGSGLAGLWSLEVGRLRARHERLVGSPDCVGIACAEAWSALPNPRSACPKASGDGFAPVGPAEVGTLQDAYVSKAPPVPSGSSITVQRAQANVGYLGGTVARRRSSHISITFRDARTWVLDTNVDPVPETFLRELVPITGLSLAVIRSVLFFGTPVPAPTLRLVE